METTVEQLLEEQNRIQSQDILLASAYGKLRNEDLSGVELHYSQKYKFYIIYRIFRKNDEGPSRLAGLGIQQATDLFNKLTK